VVVALGLGFLGLLHALIEGVLGEQPKRRRRRVQRAQRPTIALTAIFGTGLLALFLAGPLLVGSGFVETLARGAL